MRAQKKLKWKWDREREKNVYNPVYVPCIKYGLYTYIIIIFKINIVHNAFEQEIDSENLIKRKLNWFGYVQFALRLMHIFPFVIYQLGAKEPQHSGAHLANKK